MQCPECQHENREGARFCLECGAKLPPEAKFCDECGAKIGETTPAQDTPKAKTAIPKLEDMREAISKLGLHAVFMLTLWALHSCAHPFLLHWHPWRFL